MENVRCAGEDDLTGILMLYTHLHDNPYPDITTAIAGIYSEILTDPRHHIVVAEEGGRILSSCVLLVVPNLSHGQRPYALIENVVTHTDFRRRGYATKVLAYAKELAMQNNCYKLMLLTGSKDDTVLEFYRNNGYNSDDKTAFIQWLP